MGGSSGRSGSIRVGFDHQRQTVGRDGGQGRRARFPDPGEQECAMNSGVELAEKIGMTLVGFARNPRLYVYVGEERIT